MKPLSKLKKLAYAMQDTSLITLFAGDEKRVETFSLSYEDIYLDYSKHFLTREVFAFLIEWAKEAGVPSAITALFSGECVNSTEARPALHTALRQPQGAPFASAQVKAITPLVIAQKEKMFSLSEKLRSQKWLGATGQIITDVVHLGIGGSDLGPKMAVEALQPYCTTNLQLHFISNVDPVAITTVLEKLNPHTTLFVIVSKSFSTPETLINAEVAKDWLGEKLPATSFASHFIAITGSSEKALSFGMKAEHVLTFEAWVGGRYSLWSTVGFVLALSIGREAFEAFLKGAHAMDQHFLQAPLEKNMPVILALIGLWYVHGWGAPTLAVLPYAYALRSLPQYLQQLDMESNGKTVRQDGTPVDFMTGPILWGQAGTDGQHAFYQLLHQGTHFVPMDFILCAKGDTTLRSQHRQFIANALAQAQAFMEGNKDTHAPHAHMPGNKPSTMLLLNQLTPYSLGQLLALYEHKIYVQGVIWGINSFDQPGVELGKKLTKQIYQCLETGNETECLDPSTRNLIKKIRQCDS